MIAEVRDILDKTMLIGQRGKRAQEGLPVIMVSQRHAPRNLQFRQRIGRVFNELM